jgi:hypothetical protein
MQAWRKKLNRRGVGLSNEGIAGQLVITPGDR